MTSITQVQACLDVADENLDNQIERGGADMQDTENKTASAPDTRLSDVLATVDTPEGRARLTAYLATTPFPHFEAHPASPKLLVRIDEDGTRTVGHFVKRQFVPYEPVVHDTANYQV
jgi:hypothetical protein